MTEVSKKMEQFLNQIGLNEDYMEKLKNSYVERVIVDSKTNCLEFIIHVEEILDFIVYEDLLSCIKDVFHHKVNVTIKYEGNNYSNIIEYVNKLLEEYAQAKSHYMAYLNRDIIIKDYNLEIPVYNKMEQTELESQKQELENALKKFGFSNIKIVIVLKEMEIEDAIPDEIMDYPSYIEPVAPPATPSKPISTNKSYYKQKKSKEVTPVKDLLYEIDNINIEVQVFGIDLLETKNGYKIFTLKVTDYADSIYVKIFIREEEDFKKINELLKEGKWYSMYGKIEKDSYTNNELVFYTKLKDITPIEEKLNWSRTDKSSEKRVELHAHTMMSQMDGVINEEKLVDTAIKWGHRAIAITDHDGCQAFPHVFNKVTDYNKGILKPLKEKLKELKQTKAEKEANEDICGAKLIEEEIEKTQEEIKNAPTFKALYGTELEMSDDILEIVSNANDRDIYSETYVIFDTETTGFNPGLHDTMIEIGAVKMKNGEVIDRFDQLIDPGVPIDSEITELTGITNSMVQGKLNEEAATKNFKDWVGDAVLVAHNAKFDRNMLENAYYKYGLGTLNNVILDTMIISQIINRDYKRHSLSFLTNKYGIEFEESDGSEGGHHHRADYDAEATGRMFFKMLKQFDSDKVKTFKDLEKLPTKEEINKWDREKHVNIIAKNRDGLKNMFKLISYASTDYLVKSARIPRSIVEEHREGLLIGSGCYNGEIFSTALTRNEEDLIKAMEFYDYIEVQPPSNYTHLVARHDINTYEDVLFAIEKIVKCAKRANKLIVATCDAHTLNKEDKVYREIIVHQNVPGKGRHPLARYLNQEGYQTIPDQYFRTTEEMLEEFEFLGTDIAKEIVITNTNKVAELCEEYEVIIDTGGIPFSPKIDNSITDVINMVYAKAESWYGSPLPFNIEERIAKELYGDSVFESVKYLLKKEGIEEDNEFESKVFKKLHETIAQGDDEVRRVVGEKIKETCEEILSEDDLKKQVSKNLGGIIGGGFDVIYLIAQKLVKHSNDEGYLVGSRGSVGSSFVATMMGITEVNPLAAHYRCPKCKHSIFENEDGEALGAEFSSGFDLPNKNCPVCGENMLKDGQDMPFATFLGFNADKVPDIDLNFSDLNQASAHNYTKVLFGEDKVYRAGTIGTVAEKIAFGYVKGFCEDRKIQMRGAEIERIAAGCTGVKRTTGQHPGGIVVIPNYMDVFDFTPYQYPADDPESAWKTTHFDYHAIDQDVLKLDILGHTDPTQLRLIQNIRGIPVVDDVPLDDKETMGIFLSPKPLGVTSEQIMCETGTLGIPEFGTGFTISMLTDTKPESFAELIKISGLSHGTDVWLGNAQELIKSGKVPFKEVIGCRDDIMVYLMYHGVEPLKAFKIMEFVRKGKASKPKEKETWAGHVETMKKAGIEEWFIDSCFKIKYMFPKAHAAAYVISAFRIAYYKVHYPAIYYATYFSTRLDDFDIVTMMNGYEAIKNKIIELNNKATEEKLSNKEISLLETLKLSLEATARGISFGSIDIMKSDAKYFQIADDGITLIPPFRVIDGLGDTVAQSIQAEAKENRFISIEDFQKRCRVSNTLVDKMRAMNLFGDLPESSQLSLF